MPFINNDFINDLSNQVDIVDLINRRVPLKKAGKDYKACCPFHDEKTPSFTVVADKQYYHCFGCGENGSAIDFVMKYDHLNFTEAVEVVASESGISVVYDQNAQPVDPKIKRYRDLMQKVSEFYQYQLKNSPAKNKVVTYAKNRGITGKIAKRFDLGFAPPGWSGLFDHFKQDLEVVKDLVEMGLLVAKKDKQGEYYDRFRDRLMFPIHNAKGDVIAFGGRVLSEKDKPKYLNSPETPIFHKSKELYGLHHARKHSHSIDYILVVEGYMDVVALHQGGITSTVATLGTATTPQHLQTLSRTTDTIIFCFDGDRAGRAAAWKALQITLPIIKTGLVVKFLFLPDGEDPDTLVKKESLKDFEVRIEKAHTLSKFLFDHVKAELDFDTIEGKTLFIEKAKVLINQVTYDLYHQQLIEGVAQEVGQSVEQVKKVFDQQDQSSQMPSVDEPPMPHMGEHFSDFPPSEPIVVQGPNAKGLRSKMITLLLNYPSLAYENNTVEVRVRGLKKIDKKFEILLELVQSAQMIEEHDITQEELIKPFKNKNTIYNRLNQLCIMEPYLSETQAKEEFLGALYTCEKQQKNTQNKAFINNASTIEERKKVMENIQKGKLKKK
jgi:DNA primase